MFSLDLLDSDAQSNAGAVMHVVNPETGELAYLDDEQKKPVTISFLGPNSDAYKKHSIKESRKNQADEKLSKKRKSVDVEISDDVYEKGAKVIAGRLAAVATGWENMPANDKGELIPFSKEKAFELFFKLEELRTQSDAFFADKVNFI
tara:strand:- start:630 stop:1073 length:444 start_codon:yes stop_codon:yes gene_type:complete